MASVTDYAPIYVVALMFIGADHPAYPRVERAIALFALALLLCGAVLALLFHRWELVGVWAGPLLYLAWMRWLRALLTTERGAWPTLVHGGGGSWRDVLYTFARLVWVGAYVTVALAFVRFS